MNTRYQYLIVFYWVALLADCYLIYAENNDDRWISKGILMPLLIIYFVLNAPKRHHLPSRNLVVASLLLAWAGDIFLLFEGQNFFISGLLSFLAMHLLYIIYFWRIQPLSLVSGAKFVLPALLLIVFYDVAIGMKLIPLAGALGIPLIAYMAVISFMLVMASNILGSKRSKSLAPQFFIPGAVLFLASDSILGFNMFLWKDSFIGIAVMLTYGYAQQLMVHGFIKHVKGKI